MASGFALANAHIWTMDEASPLAEALLVQGSQITAVGDEKKVARKARSAGVKTADLGGRHVLPGLIDSHTHLVHQGLLRQRLDLRDTKSLQEALAAVRRHVTKTPGDTLVLAERWDESRWKERRYPRRDELDAISPSRPIILRRVDGHIAVANSPACRLVAQHLPGVDLDRGLLVEEASLNLNQVFPTPPREAEAALDVAQREALRLGVTTVHDFVVPSYLRAYQTLHRAGRLRIRAQVTPYVEYLDALSTVGLQTGLGDDRLRLGGIKLFADGSLGGHTAALRDPYRDEPQNQGRLNWTDAAIGRHITNAHRSGLQVSAHAIGDAAIDQVLAAYSALGNTKKQRHRIEHFELHAREHHPRMRDLGVVASMQPNFVGEWSRPGGMYHDRLGSPRHKQNNEFERLRKDGVHVAFGSDCMPFDPWFGLQAATRAPYPSQRLRLPHALAAYTAHSAYGLGREKDLGRLRAGLQADLILVDWRDTNPKDLAATRVLATWVAGRVEHAEKAAKIRFRG